MIESRHTMTTTVNVSDRTKSIIEGIKQYYGYKSLDAAIRKVIDESDIDEVEMIKIAYKEEYSMTDLIEDEGGVKK